MSSNNDKLETVSTTSNGKISSSLFTKARHKSCSRASLVQQQQQPVKKNITESLTDLTTGDGSHLKRMKSLPPKKKRRAPSPPKNVQPYRQAAGEQETAVAVKLHLPLMTEAAGNDEATPPAPEGVKVRRRQPKAPTKYRQSVHLGNKTDRYTTIRHEQ